MSDINETIDIILPVFNNYNLVTKCISSLYKNINDPFRLIIVDNGINDESIINYLKRLKQENDNVILVARDSSNGFSASVNRGIEVSKSEIIAILNPDIIVSRNWLNKLKQGFEFDQKAGIIAAKTNNIIFPSYGNDFNNNQEIELQLNRINIFLENKPQINFTETPFISSHCYLIKRELIIQCGGFDTIYGPISEFTDIDICFRAAKKSFRFFISNNTVIYTETNNDQVTESRLAINYTIFSMKWVRHPYFEHIPKNLFPKTIEKRIFKDNEGFYYNENLKSEPKKYLLIHPSVIDTKYFWNISCSSPLSPTGLLRVANYLLKQGHKVNYYDFEPYDNSLPTQKIDLKAKEELFIYGKSINNFQEYIENLKDIDEVYITMTMTFHYPHKHIAQIVEKVRDVFGDIKITIGGIYPTLCPDEIKKLGVEVHVGPYYNADNLRPLVEMTSETESAVMRIVKGCPRTCSYCIVPGLEGKLVTQYHKESIINIFQEFFSIGCKNYIFWDSNLLFGRENLYLFLNYLIDYGYNETITLDFSYGLEFALIDDKFIELLSKFSLENSLYVPLESSEYDLYKTRFHRPNSHLGVITSVVKKLQNANHNYMVFFVMLGLPNQTLDQVLKTTIFGWRLGLVPLMAMYTPIPGTEEFPINIDFYKDKEYWELNPFLFPCESEQLTKEDLKYIHSLNSFTLAYSEKDGFFLQRFIQNKEDKTSKKIIKTKEGFKEIPKFEEIHLNDQNHILKRIKELVYEEGITVEEIDEKTLRFYHALRI